MEIKWTQPNVNFRTKELLAHHDVVFRAPVCDFSYGLPLGDGSSGYLLWLSEDTLHVQINNTDLIDDIAEGKELCEGKDETASICRNGALLDIHMGGPVFETIYQKRFESRLSLADATASIDAETPWAHAKIQAFASEKTKTAILHVEAEYQEAMSLRAELSRWGSRSFMYWYGAYRDDTSIGLGGTEAALIDGCMCITQKLQGNNFCVAVKPVDDAAIKMRRSSSRGVEAVFADTPHVSHTYYITIAAAETLDAARMKALQQIRDAETEGAEALYQQHAKSWADFWDRSYVSLPEKQDYVENLWYLNLYYANCHMRGEYPSKPWNGVWGTFHDFVPWNCFFHYNNQLATFPLEAANHSELTETYYSFRRRQLPQAQSFAEKYKNSRGAFYTDVCDYKGRINPGTKDNCTCGAQIAMGMYQHYCYTQDETFLKETALPVMCGAGEFYLDQLKLAEDGYYHIYGTEGYESPFFLMDDSITDLAMIRALFAALIAVLPESEAAAYQERLEKLVPYQKAEFLDDELAEDGTFLHGIGKGTYPMTDHVLSTGQNPQHPEHGGTEPSVEKNVFTRTILRKTFGNLERSYYGFPDTEMAPLFPSSTMGMADRGTELYKEVYNSICLHPQIITDKKSPEYGMCMGWCMMPIYLARMGLADFLERHLEQTISAWIVYPQGFGLYGPYDPGPTSIQGARSNDHWFMNRIRNLETGEISASPAWKFRHFNYETLPIIATAVNEMLLQSYDGILRLFPAIKPESEAAFRLAATYGKIVDAVYQKGECAVLITCKQGGELKLAAEQVNGELLFTDAINGETLEAVKQGDVYCLYVQDGQQVLAKTADADRIDIKKDYSRNMAVKVLGESKLGTEKEY